ncbi:MAG: hypothetical protein R3E53_10995 [Myxococcota bacterium]
MRVILEEGLADRAFVEAHVSGVDALRAAVEPFTPERVAVRADDVATDDLVRLARLFAGHGPGVATAGTGPMSGRRPSSSTCCSR